MNDKIDFNDLRDEVTQVWIDAGMEYRVWQQVSDEPYLEQEFLTDWARIILDSPRLMLCELGYEDNDWSKYVNDRTCIITKSVL